MAKTPTDKLGAAIQKILQEYAEDVTKNTGQLAKKFAQKGATAIKNEASSRGWGEHTGYANGWTSKYETNRYSMQGIIYNKDVPGLPHLLEKSHALRNGGRTEPHPHIEPVEKMVTKEFLKAVEESI